jgi:hypothetical protein
MVRHTCSYHYMLNGKSKVLILISLIWTSITSYTIILHQEKWTECVSSCHMHVLSAASFLLICKHGKINNLSCPGFLTESLNNP